MKKNVNIINTVTQILCLQQCMLELIEELPEDNIFSKVNKEPLKSYANHLEKNVETLTDGMNVQESDSYIYITKTIRERVRRIKLTGV